MTIAWRPAMRIGSEGIDGNQRQSVGRTDAVAAALQAADEGEAGPDTPDAWTWPARVHVEREQWLMDALRCNGHPAY